MPEISTGAPLTLCTERTQAREGAWRTVALPTISTRYEPASTSCDVSAPRRCDAIPYLGGLAVFPSFARRLHRIELRLLSIEVFAIGLFAESHEPAAALMTDLK